MTTQKNFLAILLAASVTFLAGCSKDGDPGPAGTNGTNGANGTNGTNGTGFEDALAYGNIKATFSGKRPLDGANFSADQDFKYFPTANDPNGYSSVYIDSETSDKTFYIRRLLSAADDNYNANYIRMNIYVSAKGVITGYDIYAYTTIIADTKYFGIRQSTSMAGDDNNTSEIKNLTYDNATGKLKFNFTWTIKSSYSTGNDLSITGAADLTVLEALNNLNG